MSPKVFYSLLIKSQCFVSLCLKTPAFTRVSVSFPLAWFSLLNLSLTVAFWLYFCEALPPLNYGFYLIKLSLLLCTGRLKGAGGVRNPLSLAEIRFQKCVLIRSFTLENRSLLWQSLWFYYVNLFLSLAELEKNLSWIFTMRNSWSSSGKECVVVP